MAEVVWDEVGERHYESGVDHGVLYPVNDEGEYPLGVAWNGLTNVTESPSGAESNKQYADNIVYVNLISAEEFAGTIEAFMSPPEFDPCDGTAEPEPGITIGQQGRRAFGFCYRTLLGNDIVGTEFGEKLHLVYGAQATPSEKGYGTINDSPEAAELSWEFSTVPVAVTGRKPTALLVINSTRCDPTAYAALKEILYGSVGDDPRLPTPDEVIALVGDGVVDVNMADFDNQPAFNDSTNVVTLPAVTGVQWKVDGANTASGAKPALTVGQTKRYTAHAIAGYNLVGDDEWTFSYEAP